MQPLFRQAKLADVAAIHRLVESAYRGEASRVGWTTEADFLDGQRIDCEGILDAIDKPESYVLLAETDGVPVACAHIERRGDACYFGMFAVRPEMQGAGLGKALLTEAECRAQALWQSQAMRMTVIDLREDLIAWYVRRGYRRTGEHAPFPYGQERFGIPRRDDLRFEWLVKDLV
ncbi:MAG TPA: GNAT family N-acetyltransferase [Gammaproteobacteria bacterium]|nr:GNAT family N-acetyltransferase [Gammaproteobacteria bacterium]